MYAISVRITMIPAVSLVDTKQLPSLADANATGPLQMDTGLFSMQGGCVNGAAKSDRKLHYGADLEKDKMLQRFTCASL